ncbi:MAG TPA: FlgD immunoglobulin-like domain containing protein [Gaiellaceae bacterium]|nr:FlgD immunoglobulin-like domain containing protein [Gaiellaceae bacterium]
MRRGSLSIALVLAVPLLGSVGPPTGRGAPSAASPTMVVRELALGAERTPAAAGRIRFDLVGLHWQGTGTVWFRTRSLAGRWSGWQRADADAQPDAGSAEARADHGWQLGSPVWTGPSDAIRYRLTGGVRRLRAYFVRSPAVRSPLRRVSVARSPPIVPRSAWDTTDLPRRGKRRYAPAVRLVIVHHTATPNGYTAAQTAAIVRAIDLYHVKANGWDDIGYNFLVDRYGQVFEGRSGGITRNVIGAHALGFNTGSVGVSVIGNFMTAQPTAAALGALERLVAWRLDLAHVDPASRVTYVSNGGERYRRGRQVTLRAVSGHRDTGFTDCPGTYLYPLLGQIARAAERIGLPKLYTPAVRGTLGGAVRFSARLSSVLAWTVTVTGPDGRTVAQGRGGGRTVSWTWQSAGAPPGRYAWTIEAGADVLPAHGTVGSGSPPSAPPPTSPPPAPPPTSAPAVPPPPAGALLRGVTVTPATISPNGDGYADTGTISYALAAAATVTVSVLDAGGATVATVLAGTRQPAGAVSLVWSPASLADGLYTLVVSASAADGRAASESADLAVDRALSAVTASPATISPNGDGVGDTLAVSFVLAGPGEATVTIDAPDGSTVATLFARLLDPGVYSVGWDGRDPTGEPAPPGRYQAVVSLFDWLGTVTQTAPFDVG